MIFRIPDKDGPKRKYGFVDFDDYDAVDMVVTQREHYIGGVRSVYLLSIFLSFCLPVSFCLCPSFCLSLSGYAVR